MTPPGEQVIEPGAIDLGVVEIGAASALWTVTIRNVGPIETGVVLSTDSAAVSAASCLIVGAR
jgi:hypothetical protein